jgi:cytochrome c oxidase subunit 2
MFAEMTWGPAAASEGAWNVDALMLYLVAVCGAVGLGVAVALIGFAIRYRRRPGAPTPPEMRGNVPLELAWSLTPLVFFLSFFVWGAWVYVNAYRAPDDATVVYVVGKQWMWKMQHPGGQREMNTLTVPAGRPVKLLLTSEDVIHSFFVPDFRIHMDVLPGRYTSVWFTATRPGEYHLFCSQYCGTNHASMVGTVVVLPPDQFQHWLDKHPDGSRAVEGQKTFLKYRCASCHTGDGTGGAPDLGGLFGQVVPLRDAAPVVADEAYIRESILDPAAKVVAGHEPIMPTYRGQISEEEIIQIIAWLKTLGPGGLPRRVESAARPTTTPPINPREEAPK